MPLSRPPFRTHTSAAPLKLNPGEQGHWGIRPFRTHTSAAPLKLTKPEGYRIAADILPHSHECGPVEAPRIKASPRVRSPFRTHTSAAPLKRQHDGLPGFASDPSALTRVRPR